MKKSFVFIAVFFCMCANALAAEPRTVLAHSSGGWSWFAQVKMVPALPTAEANTPTEQTLIFARENGPGQQWRPLPALVGRAMSLAARSSQLAVLMDDGQWVTIWADGSATGQPLPADGKIKTLADDGNDLWAIGEVIGGINAAKSDIAKQTAATRPTTDRANDQITAPATEPSDLHTPAKLVLFRQLNGHWATVTEMPGDAVVTSADDVSLAIVAGAPVVSFKTFKNAVRTLRFDADRGWQDIGWITPSAEKTAVNFRVLSDGFKPFLWWTSGNQAGELFLDASDHLSSVPLKWNGNDKLDGLPTAIFSGDYLCVFGPHEDKVFEQRYKIDGTPIETAAELTVPKDFNDSAIPRWLESVFLCSLGFTVGSSVFRQWSNAATETEVKSLQPAPLLLRLAAGVFDAAPVIAVVIYLVINAEAVGDLIAIPSVESIVIFSSAVLLYLLHTTLAELFTARSAGKWVFGLKVVTVEGTAPTQSQLLIRNLLRIIDPLVMILISPLGQRSADTVAGTMVVGMDAVSSEEHDVAPELPAELSSESDVDGPDAQ